MHDHFITFSDTHLMLIFHNDIFLNEVGVESVAG